MFSLDSSYLNHYHFFECNGDVLLEFECGTELEPVELSAIVIVTMFECAVDCLWIPYYLCFCV